MSKVVGTFGGKGHGEWWEYNTPIPGTHEPGFAVPEVVAMPLPVGLRETLHGALVLPLAFFRMEECSIIRAREPEGIHGEKRWHLSISHPDRHPTWDEIKVARYRLLEPNLAFAIILPPPRFYVNYPAQDHVFHLHEIEDDARFWESL